MEYQQIIYQPGKVARVILNRPERLNAVSRILYEEVVDAFDRAVADEEVGAIVLSGAGEHFSSGHDLGTPEELADREERGWPSDKDGWYKEWRAHTLENNLHLRNLPKPTIAMIQGYCIYGGWQLASAMDIIFASEEALVLPVHFQYFSIPWDLGPRKAKEVLFEHRFLTARECSDVGAINRVFPKELDLEDQTLAYAERVAENWFRNPLQVRTAKFSVNHMQDTMGFTTAIEAGYQSYSVWGSDATREVELGTKSPRATDGGVSDTHVARQNLELTRPWLESNQ